MQAPKTIVITGGSDGIGLQTAKSLAATNAHIIITGRNKEKTENAVRLIKETSNNYRVSHYLVDFLDFQSVRYVAKEIDDSVDKIDVLINNAGATFSNFQLSKDGLEKTMATNHFAHFLLTGLLLPKIQLAHSARIINVSSHSHYSAPSGGIDFESIKTNKGYFIMKAYAQSKLANVLFTISLAEKLKAQSITVNSLHPGAIKTNIGNKPDMNWLHSLAWTVLQKTMGLSIEQGAKTSIYLASSDEVNNISGKYFSSTNRFNITWQKPKIVVPLHWANDGELRQELWKVSEQYTQISY